MDYKLIEQQLDELNLDGYKHIKNNKWNMPEQLTIWLEEHKFKRIGEGAYCVIYESDTENFVIKINKGYIDKGYLKFVDFCHKNKGNPHLPKMGKIKKYEDWYIIFIERLEWSETMLGIDCEDIADFISDVSRGKTENLYDEVKDENIINQILECGKLLKSLLSIDKEIYNDLHGENIMLRNDTLVITDPVV